MMINKAHVETDEVHACEEDMASAFGSEVGQNRLLVAA